MFDSSHNLPVLSAMSSTTSLEKPLPIHMKGTLAPFSSLGTVTPVHHGITPFSSTQVSLLASPECSGPCDEKPAPAKDSAKAVKTAKPKVHKWILFKLWFNTYRKFFIFITLLNLTGIIMAALQRFPYAENHLGALVLGNLLCAILMRNELFMRFLYTVAIYGLRGVSPHQSLLSPPSIR